MSQIVIDKPGYYRQANGGQAEVVGRTRAGWWVGVVCTGGAEAWSLTGWCLSGQSKCNIVDAWADDAEDAPNPAEPEQDATQGNVGDDTLPPGGDIRHNYCSPPPCAPEGDWRMLLRGETIHAGDLWSGVWTKDRLWQKVDRLIGRMQHEETASWVIRRVTWKRTGNLVWKHNVPGVHNGLCIHGYTLCYEEVSDHPQLQMRWVPVTAERN